MWSKIRDLLEMIRFSHTIFALPFALLAAVMAWTTPTHHSDIQFRWFHLAGILVAMVGARSAAMAFNRLVDRKIDADNERTQNRHLPSGRLSVPTVVVFVIVSVLLFLAGTLFFLPNYLPVAISMPVLIVLLGYSYTKRFTSLAHFWLGFALALAPICTWVAIRGSEVIASPVDILPSALLGLAVLFWVSGFDIIYACQDFEFDRVAKLQSVPVVFGIKGALRIAAICHAGMIAVLVSLPLVCDWFGIQVGLEWIYGTTVAMICLLLIYEHFIVRPDDLTRVNVAFFNINAVVSVGLCGLSALDLLW